MEGHSDTIVAIATAVGEASIAVIRVSGTDACAIVDRIWQGSVKLSEAPSHTVHYGWIVGLRDRAQRLDEVLVTVMRGPRTYTTEDVVEISTHGGLQPVQAVLAEVVRAGARLAEPGEFTKRAFLGGRIDLSQAEGVMELIAAQTKTARRAALRQVEGSLSAEVRALREEMLQLMAHVEVTIDYPEHDIEDATTLMVIDQARAMIAHVDHMIQAADSGRMLRDGIRTAIIGKPNVGKSSILNRLARAERAIVTDIPGTTRDIIEERVQVAGVPLVIMDTAGIRETTDLVEQIGVERSRRAFAEAELVLVVIDASRELDATDRELLQGATELTSLVILNKSDLQAVVTEDALTRWYELERIVHYSTREDTWQAELEAKLVALVFADRVHPEDATFIANARHIGLLAQARSLLADAVDAATLGQTLDLIAVDVKQAWIVLGEIIGETARDDLLDQIFRQFCLGK